MVICTSAYSMSDKIWTLFFAINTAFPVYNRVTFTVTLPCNLLVRLIPCLKCGNLYDILVCTFIERKFKIP